MDALMVLYLRGAFDLFIIAAGCAGLYLLWRKRSAVDRE